MSLKLHLINDQKKNNERPKLGLGYLSSYLKKYSANIEIGISFKGEDSLEIIKNNKPDLIGLTATTETYKSVIELGKEIKDTFGLPIIIGGVHITLVPKHLPPWIDIGVIGEGEQTLLELVENFRKTGTILNKNIKGIIYHEGENICFTLNRELIEPLDRIPSPDWDILGISKEGPGHILTSRGCPFNCVFCASSAFWKKTRFFSPEYVLREIKEIKERFGRTEILIYDDLFTSNKKRTREIRELICREGLDKVLRFECLSNVNFFNPEIVEDLRRMNVHRVSLGMESGSPKLLKYLKKGLVTHEKIREAISLGIDNGLEILGSFMLGVPGETEEDIQMTIDFIKDVKLTEIGANISTPFPGTELWEYAVKNGYIKDEWDDSFYLMKTINPQTIQDKKLLCQVDKNKFIELYKNLIDLDSMLIDRRIRLRFLKEVIIDYHQKADPQKKWRILDINCEDGTLAAAIKARIDVEIIGLNPEEKYLTDAKRRLDRVYEATDGKEDSFLELGSFDCLIFNDLTVKLNHPELLLEKYGKFLKPSGLLFGSFLNNRHFSHVVYALFGIYRPPFETTDGTYQFIKWGPPYKGTSFGLSLRDLQFILEKKNFRLKMVDHCKGDPHNIIEKLGQLVATFGGDEQEYKTEATLIRYGFLAQKVLMAGENEEGLLNEGCALLNMGQYAEGEKVLKEYLLFHPASLEGLIKYAEACLKTKNYPEALSSLDKISLFDPDYPGFKELRKKYKNSNVK